MAIEKVNKFEDYEFQEFGQGKGKFSGQDAVDFSFQSFSRSRDNVDEQKLVEEYDVAHRENFEIEESVVTLRKIQVAKENQINRLIAERVEKELDALKKEAFDEGYAKGFELGKEESKAEEKEGIQKSIQRVELMVSNLLDRQDELIKGQDQNINKLIRDLVKWITLKEIEKDDDYFGRLIERIVEENKESSKINFHIGAGIVASFKDSIEIINEELAKKYGDNISIRESGSLSKDAIEVELESTIIKAGLNDQLIVLDELFQEGAGDGHDS